MTAVLPPLETSVGLGSFVRLMEQLFVLTGPSSQFAVQPLLSVTDNNTVYDPIPLPAVTDTEEPDVEPGMLPLPVTDQAYDAIPADPL